MKPTPTLTREQLRQRIIRLRQEMARPGISEEQHRALHDEVTELCEDLKTRNSITSTFI